MPGTIRPPTDSPQPPNAAPAGPASNAGAPAAPGLDPKIVHARTNLASSVSILSAPASAASIRVSQPGVFGSPGEQMPKLCPKCGVHYPPEFQVCPRDAAELVENRAVEERDELVGRTLSETYTVVRVIGEGGMGRVYEARHTRIGGKRFAIKMLHPEFARQPEVIQRFQREAEAAASIKSPYVVDVYDVDRTSDGRPYMVGEFLEGQEFADYLASVGKLGAGPAVRIVRQICKALDAAHAKGVVHRDMKPENVYLTGDLSSPVAKVIDFGISKIGDDPGGPALTKTGMIMGTPAYMAPEQARGERVDHRADIYAVGAILYCALTGKRPFDRGDPTATLTAVLVEDPARPRSLEPSIPESLEMIVQRAMAKSPGDRHQSMADLDADLAPFDPGDAQLLPTPGSPGRAATGGAATGQLAQRAREATLARPMIVLLFALGLFWVLAGVVTLVAAVVRLSRGADVRANITTAESVLLFLGVAFALSTPALLGARHVKKSVWENSVKAVTLADRLRRIVLVGLGAYGLGSLLVRFVESVVLRRPVGVAWPVWDLLVFVVGAGAAIAANVSYEAEKKAPAR